jgi:hypothetical protein
MHCIGNQWELAKDSQYWLEYSGSTVLESSLRVLGGRVADAELHYTQNL